MIVHKLIPKAKLFVVTPEDSEDLWILRRIISPEDSVSGETTRIVKETGDFVRPNKGERISVSITIKVDRVFLDSALERLRIVGQIESTSDDLVSKSSSHSLVVVPMKRITIKKQQMDSLAIDLLKKGQKDESCFIIVAIDRREASIGLVKGVHLQVFPTIKSGFSGKFYKEVSKPLEPFLKKVVEELLTVIKPERSVYVVGPGHTKNEFLNLLVNGGDVPSSSALLIEGVDSAGDDGIHLALHSHNLKDKIAGSKLEQTAKLIEEAMRRLSVNDGRLTIGFSDALKAAISGSVESLLVSDRIFELGVEEGKVVNLLNQVESLRGKTFLVDTSTDIGIQVSKLGGVIGLLRYSTYN